MRSIFHPLLLLLVAVGCATGRPTRPQRGGGDQYLILLAELESTKQTNLYDAIRQTRPFWLTKDNRNRAGDNGVAVYLDEQLLGGLGALQRLPVHVMARARYMGPTEAQVRFGPNNGLRPAILLESPRQ